MSAVQEKKMAALEAIKYVKNGMKVGLGTGSTAFFMIEALGERVRQGLHIQAVATSVETERLAKKVGIPMLSLAEAKRLDLTIDGADEIDDQMQLIKGGGGALLREKIVAYNTDFNIIIADASKRVSKLGKFKLPLETIPFATQLIVEELKRMGLKPEQRKSNGGNYRTDENNDILDLDIWDTQITITDLELKLKQIPGIVETGLFLGTTDLVLIGKDDKVSVEKK